MNEKNIKALFKSIGITDAQAAEIEKDDFDPTKFATDYHAAQKSHYTDIITNEIKPQIEQEVEEKIETKRKEVFRNDVKKTFGLTAEQVKDKPLHEVLQLAKKNMEDAYSKNPNADEIQKLQAEKIEWQNKYADLEKGKQDEIEKVRREETEKTISKYGDIELNKAITSVPAEKIIGGKHSDGITRAVKSIILEKYKFGDDGKGNPIPLEKETNKRATAKDANGKEYFVTVNELTLSSLKELNFLKESNGGEGSGQGGQGNGGGQKQQKSARLLEMEAALEKQQ